jgi:hypothetical protein
LKSAEVANERNKILEERLRYHTVDDSFYDILHPLNVDKHKPNDEESDNEQINS